MVAGTIPPIRQVGEGLLSSGDETALTFLFTDLEGSTRLWESFPDAMRAALASHDAVLEGIVAEHHGFVIKGTGDGLLAGFAGSGDALTAAVAMQCAMLADEGAEFGRLRIRVALHRGPAQRRGDDYFGPTLNRCARLLAAAHADQILVTGPVVEDVPAPPPGIVFWELGTHVLRDLSDPEQIHQVLHPALPAEFPPLRGVESYRHNLPAELSSFVGRTAELAEAQALCETSRLVTLTGTSGCGKTRLALRLAAELLDRFPDGVWLVELASVTGPELVVPALARSLAVREEPGRTLREAVADYLAGRQLLLVLDNAEHVIEAVSDVALDLLRHAAGLHLVVTSQEPLQVEGEVILPVPSLASPRPARLPPLDGLRAFPAIALFEQRAAAARPGFTVTPDIGRPVAEICWRLDGIPLAIELAAARVRLMSCQQIAERLDSRFRLLTTGTRTALHRHQTLRAAVEWSYDLLSAPEQELFERIAIFAGGFRLEDAETLCAADGLGAFDLLDRLAGLIDKSLALVDQQRGEDRYRMLETLRTFGLERSRARGQLAGLTERYIAHYRELAEEAQPALAGAAQSLWLNRLEVEHDNLRAALAWAREAEPPEALRLAAALWKFWFIRGHYTEGRSWLEQGLLRRNQAAEATVAEALNGAGNLAAAQGELARAAALHTEALACRRRLGDQEGVAGSLNNLGLIASQEGRLESARDLFAESLALCRAHGYGSCWTSALANLGAVLIELGEFGEARERLGECALRTRGAGDLRRLAAVLHNLGWAAWKQADLPAAAEHFAEALALRRQLEDPRGAARDVSGLGMAAASAGCWEAAARQLLAGEVLRERLGSPLPAATRGEHDACCARARTAVGETAWDHWRSEADALELEELLAWAAAT